MEIIFKSMLVLHIFAGTTGLIAGTFAMILPRTGQNHKAAGNIFLWAMGLVFISSLYMSLYTSNWFLLCIGIFSFYLAASGKRATAFKSVAAYKNGPSLPDHLIGTGGILGGAGMLVLAVLLLTRSDSFAIVPAVFGSISVWLATRGYLNFRKPPAKKAQWVINHGTRMGGAYVAMITAFVVVNVEIEQQWILWLLPTAIIIPLTSLQIKRFLKPVHKLAFLMPSFALLPAATLLAQPNHAAISLQDYGENLIAIVNTSFENDGFELKTRLLPGMQKPLLYTDSSSRNGSKVEGQILLLGGLPYRFSGYASPDSLRLILYKKGSNQPVGSLEAGKGAKPIANIKQACTQMLDTIRQYVYNKTELSKPAYKSFESKMNLYAGFLQDEWELFAAVNRDMRSLPFSHTRFTKMTPAAFEKMMDTQYDGVATNAVLSYPTAHTALLTINQFNGDGSTLSGFMRQVIARGTTNLIIDLRRNGGGGAGAALQLVKHLSPVYQTAGALLTNKWFDTTSRLPTESDYKQFYVFSKGKTPELIKALSTHAGLVLGVTPAPEQYKGKIFVLTSANTASACEPTVFALKKSGRVTIAGERTAGKMLSSGGYYLQSGFLLTLPVADYYTVDGVRLEGNGVQPDIAVAASEALAKILALIESSGKN